MHERIRQGYTHTADRREVPPVHRQREPLGEVRAGDNLIRFKHKGGESPLFCPFCGREFSERDSKYCPFCGQDLSSPDDPLIEKIRYSDIWKMRSALVIGSVAIIVMIILLALIVTDSPEPPPAPDEDPLDHNPADLVIEVDGGQIILGDDFSDGTLKAYMNASGQLVIILDDKEAKNFSHYTWVFRDELSNTYMKKEKNEPQVIWPSPSVGVFSVICYCYTEPDDTEPAAVHNGSIHYQGDKMQHFNWIYGGKSFQMECIIPMADQQKYSSADIVSADARHGKDMSSAGLFVVTDGAVSSVESQLRDNFVRTYGTFQAGDYAYADYVLAFVQGIGFSYDSMNHYMKDYWAFPAETLFNGCGDEEDMAFLYASLLKTAGYECGLFSVPNTMMVAVNTRDIPKDITVNDGYKRAEIVRDGTVYQICEPYSESDSALGTMKECYTFDQYGIVFYYYGEMMEGDFGFIPLTARD